MDQAVATYQLAVYNGFMKRCALTIIVAACLLVSMNGTASAETVSLGDWCTSLGESWVAGTCTLTISASVRASELLYIGSGENLHINSNGTINNIGGIGINGGAINNYGTLTSNSVIDNYGSIVNGGTIVNNNYIYNNGTIDNYGTVENYGRIDNDIPQGIINNGSIVRNYGIINNGSTFNNFAQIWNFGDIDGTPVVNHQDGVIYGDFVFLPIVSR
jgi:hypothetical protein